MSSFLATHRAGWRGIGYTMAGQVPCMALIFHDAAWTIFNRWRERFGPVDEHEGLHLALVRKIASLPATNYRALMTSAPNDRGSAWQAVDAFAHMGQFSSQSVESFLEAYRGVGRYLLAPAVMTGDSPKFGFEVGIEERALSVRRAEEVGVHDVEYGLLAPRDEVPRE